MYNNLRLDKMFNLLPELSYVNQGFNSFNIVGHCWLYRIVGVSQILDSGHSWFDTLSGNRFIVDGANLKNLFKSCLLSASLS